VDVVLVGYANSGYVASTWFQALGALTLDPSVQFNFTLSGFWRFNEEGLVTQYNLAIVEFNRFVQQFGFNFSDPNFVEYVMFEICTVHSNNCTGANQQYASFEECLGFLAKTRIGDGNLMSSNTVACRQLHAILAQLRPDIHCPHIGPTGGGKCIDQDWYGDNYSPFFDESFFGKMVDRHHHDREGKHADHEKHEHSDEM